MTPADITKSLQLCGKILSKVQPAVTTNLSADQIENEINLDGTNSENLPIENGLNTVPLEKSQSDSRLNKQANNESPNNSSMDRSPRYKY